MATNDKVLSMIGLAARAGALCSGEYAVEKAVKSRHGKLVIVAGNASDNTKKCLKICVVSIIFLLGYMLQKRSWDIGPARHTELPSVFWMKVLQSQ